MPKVILKRYIVEAPNGELRRGERAVLMLGPDAPGLVLLYGLDAEGRAEKTGLLLHNCPLLGELDEENTVALLRAQMEHSGAARAPEPPSEEEPEPDEPSTN